MSLLARVKTDFETIVANTNDFGETFSYTPAGGSVVTLTGIVIPDEARDEERNGFHVRIESIHVSASNDDWTPNHGAKVTWDGRTWDFQRREHDRNGGFTAAVFESMTILNIGPITVSPV